MSLSSFEMSEHVLTEWFVEVVHRYRLFDPLDRLWKVVGLRIGSTQGRKEL